MSGVRTITATATARARRKNRRVYTLKADEDIFRAVANYQFITADILIEVTGRPERTIRHRVQMLYEAGFLNRQRRDELAPYVYFFAEKGAQEAVRLGFHTLPRATKGKSRLIVSHDLEITLFHRALETAYTIEWEQWRGALRDNDLVPDAYFTIGHRAYFLEIVKSYESEYENGISNIERKFELYSNYKRRFQEKYGLDDFRVLWVLPTQARVLGLLAKTEERFPYERFYVTDEESYKTNITGKIWWTPKDFRDRTYSIFHNE